MTSRLSLYRVALLLALAMGAAMWATAVFAQQGPDVIHQPYQLDTGLVSRSISFENPTGAPGEGGKAASRLGAGRKGAASQEHQAGRNRAALRHRRAGHDPPHLGDHRRTASDELRSTGAPGVVGRPGAPEHRVPGGRFLRHRPRQGHALLLGRAFGREPGRA